MTSLPQLTWVPRTGPRDWRAPAAGPSPVAFHRSLPGYRPTPLTEIPELAAALGVARLLVKDESERLGLPALHSLDRDELAPVPTSATIMTGLNCGTPSRGAWPYLRSGIDAAVAVTDTQAALAARDLAGHGVPAGPCGAAALAGARAGLTGAGSGERRAHLGVTPASTVVLLCTESSSANPVPRGYLQNP